MHVNNVVQGSMLHLYLYEKSFMKPYFALWHFKKKKAWTKKEKPAIMRTGPLLRILFIVACIYNSSAYQLKCI